MGEVDRESGVIALLSFPVESGWVRMKELGSGANASRERRGKSDTEG